MKKILLSTYATESCCFGKGEMHVYAITAAKRANQLLLYSLN